MGLRGLGSEGLGQVRRVGDGVEGVRVGTRVLGSEEVRVGGLGLGGLGLGGLGSKGVGVGGLGSGGLGSKGLGTGGLGSEGVRV